MPHIHIGKLRRLLEKECRSGVAHAQQPDLKSTIGAVAEDEQQSMEEARETAAKKIQNVWRKHKFQKSLYADAYTSYVSMHDDPRDKQLSKLMFGRTVAAHKKANAPRFIPNNPYENPHAVYYRTDPTYKIGNLDVVLKNYEQHPNTKSYDYIPIALSEMIPVEEVVAQYAPEHQKSIKILKRDDSQLAFIKIGKNDQKFFWLKKILSTLGLIPVNFIGKAAALGIKASPWQLAINMQVKLDEDLAKDNILTDRLKVNLPSTMSSLKRNHLKQLHALGMNENIPTHALALSLFNLVNGIPDDTEISANTVKRISLLIELATQYSAKDYDRFAFMVYCLTHELTLLLEKKVLDVSFEDFKKDALENAISYLGIPLTDKSNQCVPVAFPASSGTNAMTLALSLAKQANKNEKVAIRENGEIYFEFQNLKLEKITKKGSTSDIFLITSGPTVWTGVYPGTDINKFIRSVVANSTGPLKPTTIIVDATSGMLRNLEVDADLQHYITSGQISLLVHESHQKFGLLHSDQAQYGRVFGLCSKKQYSPELIHSFEQKAEKDLSSHLDMKVGAYINVHAGKVLESIKEFHFRNGKILRDFFGNLGLGKTKIIPNKHTTEDTERGLFVYGSGMSKIAKAIKSHLESRSSFGHFNTTWSDVGPYFRISPSASDKIDVLTEGSEIYLAVHNDTSQMISILREMELMHHVIEGERPVLEDQILMVSILHALKNKHFIPKSEQDLATWQASVKFMQYNCDRLQGRKFCHEVFDYESSPKFLTARLNLLVHSGDNKLGEIIWCVNHGASVVSAMNKINKTTSKEITEYLKEVMVITKLKDECENYINYLEDKCEKLSHERNHDKQLSHAQNKLATVKSLAGTLSFIEPRQSVESFKKKFNQIDNTLNSFKDHDRGKKFKRIILAILSGGIYSIVRATKLGSAQFWKSRREVHIGKVHNDVPGLDPKRFLKHG